MVRSMFSTVEKNKNDSRMSLNSPKTKEYASLNLKDKTLRKTRSERFVNAMKSLDAGGGVKSLPPEVFEAINDEFPEIDLGGFLLGFVSKCYLGGSFEVHTLDYSLQIVQHFQLGEALPDGMEKARRLANNSQYEFVEVYTDRCCAVDKDGNVSVIQG